VEGVENREQLRRLLESCLGGSRQGMIFAKQRIGMDTQGRYVGIMFYSVGR